MAASSNRVGTVVTFILLLVIAAAWWGRSLMRGTQVRINDKQSVRYLDKATEADARALGAALVADGYFDGQKESDVLLSMGDGGTVISFVTSEVGWKDPALFGQFVDIADRCAYSIGGLPIIVKVVDEELSAKKDFTLNVAKWGTALAFTPKEKVYRAGDATAADARALAEALKTAGFFGGDKEVDVFLRKGPGGASIGFITSEAAWTDAALIADFQAKGEALAPAVGGKSIKVLLMDGTLTVKKEIEVK